jgi:hypothetical protein
MAKVLKNIFTPGSDEILQGLTVESWHVSQSVDAFTGASDYDITISGSLDVTGPLDVTGDLDVTGNSSVSGYSTVGDAIIYATGNNLAIVESASFNPSTNFGILNNIRIGLGAGQDTAATIYSNMIGSPAGVSARSASYSNFIGVGAGSFATLASGSNFIGYGAGNFAASASNSNLFGYNVGRGDIDGNTIGPNNVIIGTNISLPYNYRNGINIGGILFGSGSYATPTGNVFSGSVGNGRIGINQPTPSFNLDVSGSGRFTNGVTVTGSFISSGSLSILSTGSIALNGPIILTGSLNTTGSVTLRGLTTGPRAFVVTIDNTTGQLYYTSSAAIISGSITPAGSNTQIQYNNAGAFAGTDRLTFDGTTLRATGSFTGSFTGNLVSSGRVNANFYTTSLAPNGITMVESYTNGYPSPYGNILNLQGSSYDANQLYLGWAGTNRAHADNYIRSRRDIGGGADNWSPWAKILTDVNYTSASINRNGDFVIPSTPIFFQNTGTTTISSVSTQNLPLQAYTANPASPAGMTFHRGGYYAVNMGLDTDNYFRIGGWSDASSKSLANYARLSLSPTGELFTTSIIVGNISPSTTPGWIYANGDVVAFSTSDKRLKDNITPISNPIEKIQKIGGYEFDWIPTEDIHSYEGHDIGVIAQEIEEVLPELVQTRDNGYKAVKYEKIVALLIEAIKDQQKQIEELKSKIG